MTERRVTQTIKTEKFAIEWIHWHTGLQKIIGDGQLGQTLDEF